jgi:hypothetical protein
MFDLRGVNPLHRRDFLRGAALGGAASFLSPGLVAALVRSTAGVPTGGPPSGDGYGPLRPAGRELALPEGFV